MCPRTFVREGGCVYPQSTTSNAVSGSATRAIAAHAVDVLGPHGVTSFPLHPVWCRPQRSPARAGRGAPELRAVRRVPTIPLTGSRRQCLTVILIRDRCSIKEAAASASAVRTGQQGAGQGRRGAALRLKGRGQTGRPTGLWEIPSCLSTARRLGGSRRRGADVWAALPAHSRREDGAQDLLLGFVGRPAHAGHHSTSAAAGTAIGPPGCGFPLNGAMRAAGLQSNGA